MRLIYKGSFEPPCYETSKSAGFDLRTEDEVYLKPGESTVVSTGCYLDADGPDFRRYLRIAPKSGLAVKFGLDVLAGVVDADYADEIKVVLHNTSTNRCLVVRRGDKIAQGIVTLFDHMDNVEVKQVVRNGGFGSTGV